MEQTFSATVLVETKEELAQMSDFFFTNYGFLQGDKKTLEDVFLSPCIIYAGNSTFSRELEEGTEVNWGFDNFEDVQGVYISVKEFLEGKEVVKDSNILTKTLQTFSKKLDTPITITPEGTFEFYLEGGSNTEIVLKSVEDLQDFVETYEKLKKFVTL